MSGRRSAGSPGPVTGLFGLLISLSVICSTLGQGYYGIRLGPLSQLHHGVSGEVFAVDARTIFIKDFNYDGEGPAAYFYVGTSARPNNNGATRLRDERGSAGVLRRYRHKDITLSMPEGKTLRDFKWFSVWCDDFSVNFGDIAIPKNLDYPRPQKIGALRGVHEVSSENIVIVDAQTLLIPNFSYDGEAPDAKFWVGRGAKPTPQGVRIPDENGKEDPLRRYDKKTIVLTLPGDLTVFDIDHFGVWCEAFTVDFGHVRIPSGMVVPPSLKMLGVSPQSKLNCEVLYDDLAFEVRWAVAGESIVIQLVAKLDGNEYMSFGLSPDLQRSEMVGGDVAVVWVDKYTGKGYAHDYFLDDKSQCSGTRGSCPDTRINDNTNSIRLLNAAMVNGYSIVTYQRPLKAADSLDLPIRTNQSQAIIWALGPLNQRNEVSFHSQYTRGDRLIDFGRQPVWNCPMPEAEKATEDEDYEEEYYEAAKPQQNNRGPIQSQVQPQRQTPPPPPPPPPKTTQAPTSPAPVSRRPNRPAATPKPASKNGAWFIPPIQCNEPEDGVFYAQMGPTGGKQGYPAITGHVGWGISWYINGLLIPEINVVRGKEYTFVVEGGFDPEIPAKYHPFYITDDSVGGYFHKTEAEKANVQIFAGLHRSRNGIETPTGVGRLCNWTPNPDGPGADEFTSFGAYQRTLSLKCDEGNPGVITWTPDENTPDTVYYQCFTHRYLGWKINVLDACDEAQASDRDEVYVDPETSAEGIDAEPSIRHETKVRAGNNFLLDHPNAENLKNHNMNEVPPKMNFQVGGKKELNRVIMSGLRNGPKIQNETNSSDESLEEENMNEGEKLPVKTMADIRIPNVHSVQHNPETGLPLFLKHPPNGQYLRPAKVPMRRYPTHVIERRPMGPPKRPLRPFVIPQPAPLMNHYKPHSAPLMSRPGGPNGPGQGPVKPVLVLGQPTEIQPHTPPPPPPPQMIFKGPAGRLPFPDHIPQGYMKRPERPLPAMISAASNTQSVKKIPIEGRPKAPQGEHGRPKFSLPINSQEVLPKTTIRPAQNTGFKPQTVIVESGFRPIPTHHRKPNDRRPGVSEQRRRADIISEIDEAIESDALLINSNHDEPTRSFEPMFIPSPRDDMAGVVVEHGKREESVAMRKSDQGEEEEDEEDSEGNDDEEEEETVEKHGGEMDDEEEEDESPNYPKITRESPIIEEDMVNMDFETGEEDKMAMSANRMDTYYLPPDNKMKPGMKIPEGAVVTYDGKAVLDTSLINSAPPNDINELIQPGLTKTEQLVRNTPQFGPFKGEMPPLSEIVPPNTLPQLKPELNSYRNSIPVTEYSNPLGQGHTKASAPISTKLTLLKASERKRREVYRQEYTTAAGSEKVLPSICLLLAVVVGVVGLRRV